MLNMSGFFVAAIGFPAFFLVRDDSDAALSVALGFLAGYCIVALLYWNYFRTRMSKHPYWSGPRSKEPQWSPFNDDQRAVEVVIELERERRFRLVGAPSMWSWRDFVEKLDTRGIERPRTIVDEATIAQLASVPLPAHMLEPEAILESGHEPRRHLMTTIILGALIALVLVLFGLWWIALLPLMFVAFSAIQLPEVRDATRLFRMDQSETVVGLGTITDKQQRRWTVDNALMLVQCRRDAGPLIVTIIGEAGDLMMPFTDEKDKDFIKLWQRWNHPSPRPDLAPA